MFSFMLYSIQNIKFVFYFLADITNFQNEEGKENAAKEIN